MCIYNICIICCILYVYIYDICIIYDNTMQKYICLTLFKVEFSPQSLPPSSLLSSPTSELHHLHQQMDQSRLELISNTDHDAYFRRHCSLMSFESIVLNIRQPLQKIVFQLLSYLRLSFLSLILSALFPPVVNFVPIFLTDATMQFEFCSQTQFFIETQLNTHCNRWMTV